MAVARSRLAGREQRAYAFAALGAVLTFDPAWRLAAAIPFDAFELLAVPRQVLWLSLTYLTLSVPFVLGGAAVALAFLAEPGRVGRVYAANLAGSGAGAALGLLLVAALPAERLPTAVALLGALALIPLVRRPLEALLPALPLALLLLPPPALPVSSYKEASMARELPGARVLAIRDGPLGRLELIASPVLRSLPGASLTLEAPVPPRPVLYRNGQPLGPRATAPDTALLALTATAAAFALPAERPPSVLVLEVGGGGAVWLARAGGARAITIVDPDARIDPLLARGTLGPDVRRIVADPRGFLRGTEERWDRIVITEIGSLHGGAAGMGAAGAAWLFTEEGIADLWRALAPGGVLAITRWVTDPPRDVPRLLATVRAVVGDDAARHVALVRGWSTATLLVSRRPLAERDVAALLDWAGERWFDVPWAPGAPLAAANRFNVLEPDHIRAAAEGLLAGEPARFIDAYPFRIAPVTDDAPFFFHFLTFPQLVRLWRAEGRLSLAYFEWGVVAQFLALVQAIPIAAVLILVPLLVLPRPRGGRKAALFLYFGLLGLAFMLLEVSAIQRLALLLAQPIVATTVVIAAFLIFAGLGSATAHRVSHRWGPAAPFVAIAVLAPLAYAAEAWLWTHAAGAPLAVRVAAATLLLAPVAYAMGMPFPLGLGRVAVRDPAWVPWCWGVNGFLSVAAAAAAPLVALGVGFTGVLAIAVGLYALAGWTLTRL